MKQASPARADHEFPSDVPEMYLNELLERYGPTKVNPTDFVLSREGARHCLIQMIKGHRELVRAKVPKGGWKNIFKKLETILSASKALEEALNKIDGLTACALTTAGCDCREILLRPRLMRQQSEILKALALVPKNHLGDAATFLVSGVTPNERLVLGCQNFLYACGHRNVGSTREGLLEHFSLAIHRLALGRDCRGGGVMGGALRSSKLKGRSTSQNLKEEALLLIISDLTRKYGPASDPVKHAEDALRQVTEG